MGPPEPFFSRRNGPLKIVRADSAPPAPKGLREEGKVQIFCRENERIVCRNMLTPKIIKTTRSAKISEICTNEISYKSVCICQLHKVYKVTSRLHLKSTLKFLCRSIIYSLWLTLTSAFDLRLLVQLINSNFTVLPALLAFFIIKGLNRGA